MNPIWLFTMMCTDPPSGNAGLSQHQRLWHDSLTHECRIAVNEHRHTVFTVRILHPCLARTLEPSTTGYELQVARVEVHVQVDDTTRA